MNCLFVHNPSSTASKIVLFWGGSYLRWRGLITWIQQLCRGAGDQDISPSQQCGMAHGFTMKLQTWLLSRTQPRTSLHSGFNIPGNNCSFLLHDIMFNYTSLSLVFRMGYSDSQMIQWQLTPTSEPTHTGKGRPPTLILDCSFSYMGTPLPPAHVHTHTQIPLFFAWMIQNKPEHSNYNNTKKEKNVLLTIQEIIFIFQGQHLQLPHWPPGESGRPAADGKTFSKKRK